MKRDTIFKAKSLDGGEWVEGDLVHYVTDTCIRVERVNHSIPVAKVDYIDIEVDPATVCQFTGVLDSKGVKVFEGDEITFEDGEIGTVDWDEGWIIIVKGDDFEEDVTCVIYHFVTGNIHDSEATK